MVSGRVVFQMASTSQGSDERLQHARPLEGRDQFFSENKLQNVLEKP